jgi:CheY-like chemotaxis protein
MLTNTPPPQDGQTSSEGTNGSSREHTVLYIEDNSTNRQLVRYIIDMHPGLTLIEAEDGKQGLEAARRFRPNLILLDIHLPDMDGFTIFKHLQSDPDTVHIPVVALSGSAAPRDIQRGMTTGFRKFLSKPIDIKEFNSTLSSILG